jgi:hypothetical protein
MVMMCNVRRDERWKLFERRLIKSVNLRCTWSACSSRFQEASGGGTLGGS